MPELKCIQAEIETPARPYMHEYATPYMPCYNTREMLKTTPVVGMDDNIIGLHSFLAKLTLLSCIHKSINFVYGLSFVPIDCASFSLSVSYSLPSVKSRDVGYCEASCIM